MPRVVLLFLAVSAAVPASAGQPVWKFKPGQTFTYECQSEFHFAAFSRPAAPNIGNAPRAAETTLGEKAPPPPAPRNPPPGGGRDPGPPPTPGTAEYDQWLDLVRREEIRWALQGDMDPARREALEALLNKSGLITTEEILALGVDPQWETVVLEVLVEAVGDDGAARVKVTVKSVRIETRFDDTGEHATWESTKKPTTDFTGFKPYQAMVGHSFGAVVGADGEIREVTDARWPDAEAAPNQSKLPKREVKAANATHAPTSARTWLELIFATVPSENDQWVRNLRWHDVEAVEMRIDSGEKMNGYNCARVKMRSRDREHAVNFRKQDPKEEIMDVALVMVCHSQKLGESWFSRNTGCTVKVEMKASTETSHAGRFIVGDFKLEVNLKDRGFVDLRPEPGPVETK